MLKYRYCLELFKKMLMRVYQHRKGAVMNSKLKTPAVEQLFDAILSLENKEECAAFFEIAFKRG